VGSQRLIAWAMARPISLNMRNWCKGIVYNFPYTTDLDSGTLETKSRGRLLLVI
jgi:hypothetical protein